MKTKPILLAAIIALLVVTCFTTTYSQTPAVAPAWECAIVTGYPDREADVVTPGKIERIKLRKNDIGDHDRASQATAAIVANQLCQEGWEPVSGNSDPNILCYVITLKRRK